MRTFVRILAIAAGIVALLLIAVAIAVATIDVNSFVGPIQARVKQETGRELAIRGGIDLKLSLEPKLVASDVTFGNADWAKAPAMLTAKRIEGQVRLLPLLQRRFEVVRFALIEPSIALETDGRGRRNWDFGRADKPPAPAASAAGASLPPLGVGNVEIANGALTYLDGASGKTTNVAIDKLVVIARTPGSPVNAEFRGRIDDVPVAVAGTLGPLDVLAQRKWPYPVAIEGEINGQKTSIGAKVGAKDDAVTLDDLAVAFGASHASGAMSVATGGPRPAITFNIASPTLAVKDLPLPVRAADAKAKAAVPAPAATGARDEPMGFAVLRDLDANGDLAIEQLLLPEGRHVDAVRAKVALRDGVLDVPSAQMSAFGGVIKAKVRIDAKRHPDDALSIAIDAKGLDLGALALAAGVPRDIKGGKTDVAIDVTMRGASQRQWLASANGTVIATVGPATLVNLKGKGPSALDELASAVNPFRGVQQSTELKCAVARFPVRDGVARVDRTIALETRELGIAASGTLDLRNETLDLAVKPYLKQGIPIDLVQLASLVRVSGPFASPSVQVDKAATAETVAKLGAAYGTGGLAAIAGVLMKPAAGDANTCDVALGRAPKETSPPQPASQGKRPAAPADEIGRALGRLLGGK